MEKIRNVLDNLEDDESEVIINNMIGGELINDEELWLHVDDVRKSDISEKLYMLKMGLRKLAYMLDHEEKLKKVKIISGTSWIVAEHPKLMESLGFEVTNDPAKFTWEKNEYDNRKDDMVEGFKDRPAAHAFVSREKFIELYGQKKQAA